MVPKHRRIASILVLVLGTCILGIVCVRCWLSRRSPLLGELFAIETGAVSVCDLVIRRAGDVDGDQRCDLLVGNPTPAEGERRIEIRSAADGRLLRTQTAPESNLVFDSIDDVDGDGCSDLVFAIGSVVRILSSTNGDELHSKLIHWEGRPADALVGLGDVDGDRRGDFAALLPALNAPRVEVRRGFDGGLVYGRDMARAEVCMARADDLDGDSLADLLVSEWSEPTDKGTYARQPGRVLALSGRDGRALWSIEDSGGAMEFGRSIALVGDGDGDGHADLAIGADGWVAVHSGDDGRELLRLEGDPRSDFGAGVAGAGDVDGDRRPDILVVTTNVDRWSGNPFGAGARFQVFSGRDGNELVSQDVFLLFPPGEGFVLALDDWNGDGHADFALAVSRRPRDIFEDPASLLRATRSHVVILSGAALLQVHRERIQPTATSAAPSTR